jgi:uncharacterized protein (TIGR00290 family)
MTRPRAWLAWSSGKDSAWALHEVRAAGDVDVVGLLTTYTAPHDRVSMHGVRMELVRAQAEAVGLPLVTVPIPAPCPNEIYEARMEDALSAARTDGVTHIVFGDLFLEDVRAYRIAQLARAGMTPLFPLWLRDTRALVGDMLAAGVEAWITCLDPRALPAALAGQRLTPALIASLPASVDPCFERGEAHTFCAWGPAFSHPIRVEPGITVERDGFVFADLTCANAGAPT